MKIIATILLAASVAFSGCVSTHVQAGSGDAAFVLDRTAVATKSTIANLEYDPTTKKFVMKGYSNEVSEIAGAMAEAFGKTLENLLAKYAVPLKP